MLRGPGDHSSGPLRPSGVLPLLHQDAGAVRTEILRRVPRGAAPGAWRRPGRAFRVVTGARPGGAALGGGHPAPEGDSAFLTSALRLDGAGFQKRGLEGHPGQCPDREAYCGASGTGRQEVNEMDRRGSGSCGTPGTLLLRPGNSCQVIEMSMIKARTPRPACLLVFIPQESPFWWRRQCKWAPRGQSVLGPQGQTGRCQPSCVPAPPHPPPLVTETVIFSSIEW